MIARCIVALAGGIILSTLLLLSVHGLVEGSARAVASGGLTTVVEFVDLTFSSRPPPAPLAPPPPPEPVPAAEDLSVQADSPTVAALEVALAVPVIESGMLELDGLDIGLAPSAAQAASSRAPVPIAQPRPIYPETAARRGLEGWVRVSFTVDERGAVLDPSIDAAEPRNVFDRAALLALGRWRFEPAMLNGVAVKQRVTQTIEFELER